MRIERGPRPPVRRGAHAPLQIRTVALAACDLTVIWVQVRLLAKCLGWLSLAHSNPGLLVPPLRSARVSRRRAHVICGAEAGGWWRARRAVRWRPAWPPPSSDRSVSALLAQFRPRNRVAARPIGTERVRAPTPPGHAPRSPRCRVPGTPVGRRRPRTAAAGANRGGRSRAAAESSRRVARRAACAAIVPARQSLSSAPRARGPAPSPLLTRVRPRFARPGQRERGPIPSLGPSVRGGSRRSRADLDRGIIAGARSNGSDDPSGSPVAASPFFTASTRRRHTPPRRGRAHRRRSRPHVGVRRRARSNCGLTPLATS